MSCGEPHETDCGEVLAEVFLYLDGEVTTEKRETIRRHLVEEADLTVCENLPEGAYGEIISLAALRRSHDEGTENHRSAWVSLYIFEHAEKFKILRLLPPEPLRRPDIRITVDYPEDLVVCRAIYAALGGAGGRIRIEDIIKFLDSHPDAPDFFISEEITCRLPGVPFRVDVAAYGLTEAIHHEAQRLRGNFPGYAEVANDCISLRTLHAE